MVSYIMFSLHAVSRTDLRELLQPTRYNKYVWCAASHTRVSASVRRILAFFVFVVVVQLRREAQKLRVGHIKVHLVGHLRWDGEERIEADIGA